MKSVNLNLSVEDKVALTEFVYNLSIDEGPFSFLENNKDNELYYFKMFIYRFESILSSLRQKPVCDSILDIGTTPFTLFLREKYRDINISTIDRTNLLKDRCTHADINHFVVDLDMEEIPFKDNEFDVIICTEVLEHVFAPPRNILFELKRIVKETGLIILSVPNIATLSNRLKLLLGKQILSEPDKKMRKNYIHGHGHLHEYTKQEFVSLCRCAGLTVVQVKMLSEPVRQLLNTIIFKYPHRLAYHILKNCYPGFRNTIQVDCLKCK